MGNKKIRRRGEPYHWNNGANTLGAGRFASIWVALSKESRNSAFADIVPWRVIQPSYYAVPPFFSAFVLFCFSFLLFQQLTPRVASRRLARCVPMQIERRSQPAEVDANATLKCTPVTCTHTQPTYSACKITRFVIIVDISSIYFSYKRHWKIFDFYDSKVSKYKYIFILNFNISCRIQRYNNEYLNIN